MIDYSGQSLWPLCAVTIGFYILYSLLSMLSTLCVWFPL